MQPFLKQIAHLFYDRYGADIHRLAFVFPNRRSGLFFRKYLSEASSQPVFSPAIWTINELFCKLHPKQKADPLKLLFLLYNVYIRQSGKAETFDDFVYWGQMLLNDFDDVDKYLVDAKQLFTNVTDLNVIETDFSFLNPTQVQAIRTFWSSFQPESADSNKKTFLQIWEILFPVYTSFRKSLEAEGLAYEGMIYREVVEHFRNHTNTIPWPYEKIIFVGLNALTVAERELLKALKNQGIADFYWDYSSEKIRDTNNRASYFVNENRTMFPSTYPLPEEEPSETQFELIGVPSGIGQAKQIYPLLEQLVAHHSITAEEAFQTAIILPDEQLLMPVLHAIPEKFDQINVTLGYSLSGAPVATLMDILQSLQKNFKLTTAETLYYHSDVIAILSHRYITSTCPVEAATMLRNITEHNQIYISETTLQVTPLLQILFSAPANVLALADYLLFILKELTSCREMYSLEKEFIYQYYTIINRIRDLIQETPIAMTSDTFFKLLKQVAGFMKIPFQGEPLSGLQVMGVLETRLLDFDNLIILSVNEGTFPTNNASNSFIPYHLRRGFGLPTPEHQESVWAYHFYRMIYRAKRVIMLYDTRTDGLKSGEVSRYVHQLRYLYQIPVKQKVAVYNVASSTSRPFHVEKDEEVMRLLTLYETEKSLSASVINTYLDCPLKFYFSAIKGIDEEKVVSETLRHDAFGTLLHRVMELAYKPYCGQTITTDLLKNIAQEKNMTELIQNAFAKDYFHSEKWLPLTGQVYLYGETIRKYACKILEYDRSLTPFCYIGSEMRFNQTLKINHGRIVRIKGFIDRVDQVKDKIRIVDYKTGKPDKLLFPSMESLFDRTQKERQKAILQVFLYAWVYALETGHKQIQPAIYYVINLFKQSDFDPTIVQQVEKTKTMIDCFENEKSSFENHLSACLNELFDAGQPFIQTSNAKNCVYCPFAEICGR